MTQAAQPSLLFHFAVSQGPIGPGHCIAFNTMRPDTVFKGTCHPVITNDEYTLLCCVHHSPSLPHNTMARQCATWRQTPTNSPHHSVVLLIRNLHRDTPSTAIASTHRQLCTHRPRIRIFLHTTSTIDTYHAVSTAYSTVFAANSSSMPKWTSPSLLHYICLVNQGYGALYHFIAFYY